MPNKFMFWDFNFTVKNQNLPKCRIFAELFYQPPIGEVFFRGFRTNCTIRIHRLGRDQQNDECLTMSYLSISVFFNFAQSGHPSVRTRVSGQVRRSYIIALASATGEKLLRPPCQGPIKTPLNWAKEGPKAPTQARWWRRGPKAPDDSGKQAPPRKKFFDES